MISLIRYPGSKAKLADEIRSVFPAEVTCKLWMNYERMEYREPFFGAGAVGFDIMDDLPRTAKVWINDLDYGMYSLWECVRVNPQAIIDRCRVFEPTADWFYKFKEADGDKSVPVEQAGFRKLALHRMSYSGLGAMAGGPIGGRQQNNDRYNASCRWNPEYIKREVNCAHRLFQRFDDLKITNLDFQAVIDDAPAHAFLYLDSPYYEKGPQLYVHGMSEEDHARLCDSLQSCAAAWVLSYDDHPEIRKLYDWCEFSDLHVTYTMGPTGDNRPKNREVLIRPRAAVESIRP